MCLLRWGVLLSLVAAMTFVLGAKNLCKKGHRRSRKGGICEPCPMEQFMPEENGSQSCRPCRQCDPESGSELIRPCSSTEDTQCQCRAGFIPWEPDMASCKCNDGFDSQNGECRECPDGYFSNSEQETLLCLKWRGCGAAGVRVNGTKTTDTICNGEAKMEITNAVNPPFNKSDTAHSPPQVTPRLSEDQQTEEPRHSNTTPSLPDHEPEGTQHPLPDGTEYSPGMAVLFVLGILGLIVLSVVGGKFYIIPRIRKNQIQEEWKDSTYRRPVEECGDSNCSSRLEP